MISIDDIVTDISKESVVLYLHDDMASYRDHMIMSPREAIELASDLLDAALQCSPLRDDEKEPDDDESSRESR